MGPFLLPRCSVFVSELNMWEVIIAFKGQDPHYGFSPTASKGKPIKHLFKKLDILFTNTSKPNHLAFVPHFGTAACNRTAPSSIFPPTGFANSEMPQPSRLYPLNYLNNGSYLLGDIHSFHNHRAQWRANFDKATHRKLSVQG